MAFLNMLSALFNASLAFFHPIKVRIIMIFHRRAIIFGFS
ncbi:hypothetical protein BGAFAR04_K0017 (plasmid) [Borreliella garinii Far04]|nr:hypothetical protein BGAFAR04_K0017 [Borreliella garinii Far04]